MSKSKKTTIQPRRSRRDHLEEKVNDINRFYRRQFKKSFKSYFDVQPSSSSIILEDLNIGGGEEENDNLNSINDMDQRKSTYYYLWTLLYDHVKKKKKDDHFIVERDIKTMIVNMFLLSRPLISKIDSNLDHIKLNDFSSLNDTLYSHVNNVNVIRETLIGGGGGGENYQNPYIDDAHEYNDKVHLLLIELIPLLPTLMFIVFPLDYLPIFAFSLVFHSLLRSNRFSELSHYYGGGGGGDGHTNEKNEGDEEEDDETTLINVLPYITNEGDSDIIDTHSPHIKFNIGQFVVNTRKRLLYHRTTSLFTHQSSYFPFIINNVNTSFSKGERSIACIDAHFQPNRLFLCYQKLSQQHTSTTTMKLNMYLVNEENDDIVSTKLPLIKKFEQEAYYENYYDTKLQMSRALKAATDLAEYMEMDSNVAASAKMMKTIPPPPPPPRYNSDYWRSSLIIKGAEDYKPRKTTRFTPLQDLTNVHQYSLRFENENEGYYVNVTLGKSHFSDKTKYIGIYHNGKNDADILKLNENAFGERNPNHHKTNDGFLRTMDRKFHSFEEEIGIKEDLTLQDTHTTIEILKTYAWTSSYKMCSLRIHCPFLAHLQTEYKRCIASLKKSILLRDNKEYDPYSDESIRILVQGKISNGRDIYIAVIPLIDFTNPTMTIDVHAFNYKNPAYRNADGREGGILSQDEELDFHDLLNNIFERRRNYNTIMFNQTINNEEGEFALPKDTSYGRIKHVFYNRPIKYQGFYIEPLRGADKTASEKVGLFDELTKKAVTDLKLVVFRAMKVGTGEIKGNAIKIHPYLSTTISFDNSTKASEIMLVNSITRNSSIMLNFIIIDKKHDIYIENGMIDKFSITIKTLRETITEIRFIYGPTIDDVQYDGSILLINTTDQKLSHDMSVYTLDKITFL